MHRLHHTNDFLNMSRSSQWQCTSKLFQQYCKGEVHIFLNLFTKNIHDLARYLNDGFFVIQCKSECARIDVINPEFNTLLIGVMNSGLMMSFQAHSDQHGTMKNPSLIHLSSSQASSVCLLHFTVNYAQILQELRLLNLSLSYIHVILIYYNILVHCIVQQFNARFRHSKLNPHKK